MRLRDYHDNISREIEYEESPDGAHYLTPTRHTCWGYVNGRNCSAVRLSKFSMHDGTEEARLVSRIDELFGTEVLPSGARVFNLDENAALGTLAAYMTVMLHRRPSGLRLIQETDSFLRAFILYQADLDDVRRAHSQYGAPYNDGSTARIARFLVFCADPEFWISKCRATQQETGFLRSGSAAMEVVVPGEIPKFLLRVVPLHGPMPRAVYRQYETHWRYNGALYADAFWKSAGHLVGKEDLMLRGCGDVDEILRTAEYIENLILQAADEMKRAA